MGTISATVTVAYVGCREFHRLGFYGGALCDVC